jgi:hypothetical protein
LIRHIEEGIVVETETTQPVRVISLLNPDRVAEIGGLSQLSICGSLVGDGLSKEAFRPNPAFVAFMHEVIKKAGLQDDGLQAAAAGQTEGWVYVIDLRTPDGPQGRVPVEDIVGGFRVERGKLSGEYWANDKHLVYSESGLMRLPPSLEAAIIAELRKIALASPTCLMPAVRE